MPERAEMEAVARAWGYRPGAPYWKGALNDASVAIEALNRVRDARGDGEAELREKIADELAENDQCGVGPLSRQEYLDDAEAVLSLIRTYGGTQAARSPQGEDHEADLLRIRAALLEWDAERAKEFVLDLTSRRLWPEALPSSSRDGTVAVEDWRTTALQLAALLRELHPQNPYYREKQAEALAAFDALAGESKQNADGG
jgi:hypothetical protein